MVRQNSPKDYLKPLQKAFLTPFTKACLCGCFLGRHFVFAVGVFCRHLQGLRLKFGYFASLNMTKFRFLLEFMDCFGLILLSLTMINSRIMREFIHSHPTGCETLAKATPLSKGEGFFHTKLTLFLKMANSTLLRLWIATQFFAKTARNDSTA